MQTVIFVSVCLTILVNVQNCEALCDAGFTVVDNGECMQCNPGKYSVSAGDTCRDCDTGKFSVSLGATSSDTCISCGYGKYSVSPGATDASSCHACPAHSYSNTIECFCGGGHEPSYNVTANSILSECVPCAVGKTKYGGNSMCLPCQAGTYMDVTGGFFCKICPLGLITGNVTGSISCYACPENTYIHHTTKECICDRRYGAISTINAGTPHAGCRKCTDEEYIVDQYEKMNEKCVACSQGTMQAPDNDYADQCHTCVPGYRYYTENRTVADRGKCGAYCAICVKCEAGKYKSGVISRYYSNSNIGFTDMICNDCQTNEVSLPGSTSCTKCPMNQVPGPDKSSCVCREQYILVNNTCIQCGGFDTENCSVYVAPVCTAGYTRQAVSASISVCEPCAAGQFSYVVNQTSQIIISRHGNVMEYLDFIFGTYTRQHDMINSRYHYKKNGTYSIFAGNGNWNIGIYPHSLVIKHFSAEFDVPMNAQWGANPSTFFWPSSYLVNQFIGLRITMKFVQEEVLSKCTSCPVGTYTKSPGSSICSPCASNDEVTGATSCSKCAIGKYAVPHYKKIDSFYLVLEYGEDFLEYGEFYADDTWNCRNKYTGTTWIYHSLVNDRPAYVMDSTKNYPAASISVYSEHHQWTSPVYMWYYPNDGWYMGTSIGGNIPRQHYRDDSDYPLKQYIHFRAAAPHARDVDEIGDTWETHCGYHSILKPIRVYIRNFQQYVTGGVCQTCPVDNATMSNGTCLCKRGYTNASPENSHCVGCITCQLCMWGKYKNTLGSTPCEFCEVGKYLNASGSSCHQCPTENLTGIVAFSDISKNDQCVCKTGYGLSNSACYICEIGKYKGIGNETCKDCPVGKYSNARGASLCDICPSNSVNSNGNTHCLCNRGFTAKPLDLGQEFECVECGIGSYKDTIGNHDCTLCENEFSTVNIGGTSLLSCSTCAVGYSKTGVSICTKCDAAKYKDTVGDHVCTYCTGKQIPYKNGTSCTPCPLFRVPNNQYCGCQEDMYEDVNNECRNCFNNSNSNRNSKSIASCTCNNGYVRILSPIERCEPVYYSKSEILYKLKDLSLPSKFSTFFDVSPIILNTPPLYENSILFSFTTSVDTYMKEDIHIDHHSVVSLISTLLYFKRDDIVVKSTYGQTSTYTQTPYESRLLEIFVELRNIQNDPVGSFPVFIVVFVLVCFCGICGVYLFRWKYNNQINTRSYSNADTRPYDIIHSPRVNVWYENADTRAYDMINESGVNICYENADTRPYDMINGFM